MDISSQLCLITGGSDLEDSWSILRLCCSQTQEDSPLILLSSTIAPTCLKHAVSENHRKPIPCSSPFSTWGDRITGSHGPNGSPHSGVLRLELCWDSGCGVCGCGAGAAIVTAMGAVAAGTCTVNAELLGFPNEDISHIMGISWAYGRNILSYVQHITTYYKMEPKLSMWQNDANITLAKLLEVHEIQLAHLVDSTYRLVEPHVRC